jgi:hypothetical protein
VSPRVSRALRTAARVTAAFCALVAVARADEMADYDPHSTAWNGLSQLVALAEGSGFTVTPVSELDWNELGAEDILFLVYPTRRVDPVRLLDFVQAGGNAVIADDFGDGEDAMSALGLLRAKAPRASRTYEGRAWAPIATAQSDHPIARDVGEVVTNHPAALEHTRGATTVIGFDEGALVVAGERGTGRFVAVADPSIFINRMQQEPFRGNVQLAANILRWLDRDHRATHIVLLRGDVPTYGDPQPFIDDPHSGTAGRTIQAINKWLGSRSEWLLTPGAMKAVAAGLAVLLLVLAIVALPVRRGPRIDGAWLKFARPSRRDDPHALVSGADGERGPLLVLACILRDQVQGYLADVVQRAEPLYTVPEAELVARVAAAHGNTAGIALSRVYPRLRALPSRSQAAAPWSSGTLPRRDFESLYRDVAELCRTLGHALSEA